MTRIIKGIKTKALRVIPDERGRLFEMLRRDDPLFTQFGQVYCTTVHNGVVKAYPIFILDGHEIVNDEFAGSHIGVYW